MSEENERDKATKPDTPEPILGLDTSSFIADYGGRAAKTSTERETAFGPIEPTPGSKERRMAELPEKLAGQLRKKYKVHVVVVGSDDEFYSDARIATGVVFTTYYISAESPELTARITDWHIRYTLEKDKYLAEAAQERKLELLEIANEKRAEKSVQTAQDVAPKIAEITKQYSDAHSGKEPSLHKLADLLNDAKVPAPGGLQSKWYAQTVKRIINAEKSGHQK